jgi:hypothetical protein
MYYGLRSLHSCSEGGWNKRIELERVNVYGFNARGRSLCLILWSTTLLIQGGFPLKSTAETAAKPDYVVNYTNHLETQTTSISGR